MRWWNCKPAAGRARGRTLLFEVPASSQPPSERPSERPSEFAPEMNAKRAPTRPLTLGRDKRLAHAREYERVYEMKLRKSRGPLTVFGAPNESGGPRLGLSIGRKVGNAVARNRVKRMVREAFRQVQYELPPSGGGFDWVVSSRAHDRASLEEYRGWLLEAAEAVAREWEKRAKRGVRVEGAEDGRRGDSA